jgi:hypothetical protein
MGENPARRAAPIREEDILEVAMERFWAAEGGNQEGVKAVLKFARAVYLDIADDAAAALKGILAHMPDHPDTLWEAAEEAASKLEG